jgi:uncharacterized protein (TIGR03083 family)
MADRTFTADEATVAFREAAHWWRSLVGGIDDHQWDRPGLGEWSVRELVAHGARAFRTIAEYASGDVKDPTPIATAAEYFRIVLAEETPHVHIAERARREAAVEADWTVATDVYWAAADRVVGGAEPDAPMHLFVGVMPFSQYLPTRVVELVVHGTDLAKAIAIPSPPPRASARIALEVLLDLAPADDLGTIARFLTGRPGSLPLTDVLA